MFTNKRQLVLVNIFSFLTAMVFTASAYAQNCGPDESACADTCIPKGCICLLGGTPGGQNYICDSQNDPAWGQYFDDIFTWGLAIGVGLAVMNVVIGGFQITMSQGDSGKIGEGKTRIIWSIAGLMMLMFAGVILNFINPSAFRF